MPDNAPHNALRHHVTGAIERGESEPITAREDEQMTTEYITTAHYVEHADGRRGPCYVLVGTDAIVALTIRDAQRMQAGGTPYRRPEVPNDAIGDLLTLRPDATYFPPDFPSTP